MNLKNNKIKLEEILNNPQARQVLESEFSDWIHSPLVKMAKRMTLGEVLQFAQRKVPQAKIQSVLEKLTKL